MPDTPITPAQRRKQGICAGCFKFKGTDYLVVVRGKWVCFECGEREIRTWNENLERDDNGTLIDGHAS